MRREGKGRVRRITDKDLNRQADGEVRVDDGEKLNE